MKNKIYFNLFPDKTFLFYAVLPMQLCLLSSFPQVPILASAGSLLRSIFFFPSSLSHPLAFHMCCLKTRVKCWFLFWLGDEGEGGQGRGWFSFFWGFFLPVPASSVFFRPQITAFVSQPIFPFLLPKEFHWGNMRIFFLANESLRYSLPFLSHLLWAAFPCLMETKMRDP